MLREKYRWNLCSFKVNGGRARPGEGEASGAELNGTGASVISRTQLRLDSPPFVLFAGYFQQLNGLLRSGCSAGSSGVEGAHFCLELSKLMFYCSETVLPTLRAL